MAKLLQSHPRRTPWRRLRDSYERRAASFVFRQRFRVNPTRAVISFTFDDFPQSALHAGGGILERYGLRATYYACLGLMGEEIATGKLFDAADLQDLVGRGHELGCHTYSHSHAWQTDTRTFEQSVIDNGLALQNLLPGMRFETLSFPISTPRPLTKAKIAGRFLCCRSGGQTFNKGVVDLNQLSAFFLEKSRNDFTAIKEVIDRNCRMRGWLIFATHDIADNPTPYGCTPQFFEQVVAYASSSNSSILPMMQALRALRS